LVQRAPYVLECWTVLSALAGTVSRVVLGPLVLNVANRDAGTLAVMAATLQEVCGSRLMLGIGAGGGSGTTYGLEQEALGRTVASDPDRDEPSSGQSRRCERCGRAERREKEGSCAPPRHRRS
jgi:hypothetical protein